MVHARSPVDGVAETLADLLLPHLMRLQPGALADPQYGGCRRRCASRPMRVPSDTQAASTAATRAPGCSRSFGTRVTRGCARHAPPAWRGVR